MSQTGSQPPSPAHSLQGYLGNSDRGFPFGHAALLTTESKRTGRKRSRGEKRSRSNPLKGKCSVCKDRSARKRSETDQGWVRVCIRTEITLDPTEKLEVGGFYSHG